MSRDSSVPMYGETRAHAQCVVASALIAMPRVYIGRLSYHVREKDIQRFFSGYGKLLEVDLKNG